MSIRLSVRQSALLAGVALLAACGRVVPAPSPQPVTSTPAPRPAPAAVTAPVVSNWVDAPATPGTWRHRIAGRDSIADFVGTDGRQLFQLICTQDREVMVARVGMARDAQTMTVRTRTLQQNLRAGADANAIRTTLNPRDPLLGAMAYSRGRFAVEVPGLSALYLPSWPEVTRVIDDCQ